MEQVRLEKKFRSLLFFNKIYFRYLTVFRDLQQSEGRPGVPTEWNGEKDKTKHEVNISILSISNNSFY
jgi:hypothetical protein